MTTFFDRIQHFLIDLKSKLSYEEYCFLRDLVDGIHDFQHSMNSHELDDWLLNKTMRSPFGSKILKKIGYLSNVILYEKK